MKKYKPVTKASTFSNKRKQGSNIIFDITCGFCGTTVTAYLWSLAGSGKLCPGCGALHTLHYTFAPKKPKK